jgi:hypothetical protein
MSVLTDPTVSLAEVANLLTPAQFVADYVGSTAPIVVTLPYSATVNTNAILGSVFNLTLTGNVILATPTNGVDAQTLRWRIRQDATGNRTITLGAGFRIPSSATLPLDWSTVGLNMDILAATYNAIDTRWDVVSVVPGYLT